MTEEEIRYRIERVKDAVQRNTSLNPLDVEPYVRADEHGAGFFQDFTGGRTQIQLESAVGLIINEIMAIRDRAKKWLVSNGGRSAGGRQVHLNLSRRSRLSHDLANTDKHGELDKPSMSGHKPKLAEVESVMTLVYDPATGTYANHGQYTGPTFDLRTGQMSGGFDSSGFEVVLDSEILDEHGNVIGGTEESSSGCRL